jgi:glucose-6-phosphate-specific signal transduction histidine kinase
MTRHSNRSIKAAFMDLNIGVAFALMFFAVSGLIMTGLAADVIDLMTRYRYLPLAASMGAYAVTFAASGTRDPRYYHPVEWMIVTSTGVLMVSHAVLSEIQDLVTQYDPWASIVIMALMVITGAILAR